MPHPALAAAAAAAVLLFTFQDPEISESSGVAASARAADVVFTHNDSGDGPRFFAVGPDGASRGTFELDDAVAFDWEDMARAYADDGTPLLFLGDIGDNYRVRSTVVVYEVVEPVADGGASTVPVRATHRLRYEDGPHNAETLLVHPRTRQIWIVTKERAGPSVVYRAAGDVLRRAGEVRVGGLATGGALSPDGRRVVVRAARFALEWEVGDDGDVAAAMRRRPVRIDLPDTRQGEAITYSRDGRDLLVTSEGRGAPVHRIPGDRPAVPVPAVPAESSPTTTTATATTATTAGREAEGGRAGWVGAAAVLALVAAGATRARRRPRRARRPGP